MPKPPWPSTLSIRYSKSRNPAGRVMVAAAGEGASMRLGSLAAREAAPAWVGGRAEGSMTVFSVLEVLGSKTVGSLPRLPRPIEWTSSSGSAPDFGLSAIPLSPWCRTPSSGPPLSYHKSARPTGPENPARTNTYRCNFRLLGRLRATIRKTTWERGLGDGDDTRPIHNRCAGGELLRRRHGGFPQLLQVPKHDRRHREVARAR